MFWVGTLSMIVLAILMLIIFLMNLYQDIKHLRAVELDTLVFALFAALSMLSVYTHLQSTDIEIRYEHHSR